LRCHPGASLGLCVCCPNGNGTKCSVPSPRTHPDQIGQCLADEVKKGMRTKSLPLSFNCATLSLQKVFRHLAPSFRPVEVAVEADDCKPVALRNRILVGIVEVEIELLGRLDEAFHLLG